MPIDGQYPISGGRFLRIHCSTVGRRRQPKVAGLTRAAVVSNASSYERMVTVETIGHKGEPAIRTVCCCKSPRAFERAVNASMPPHLMV